MLEPVGDVPRLFESHLELDPLRKTLPVALQRCLDPGRDLEDVVAFFLIGRDEDRALAVEATRVGPRLGFPTDVREIAYPHEAPTDRRDDGIANLIE